MILWVFEIQNLQNISPEFKTLLKHVRKVSLKCHWSYKDEKTVHCPYAIINFYQGPYYALVFIEQQNITIACYCLTIATCARTVRAGNKCKE